MNDSQLALQPAAIQSYEQMETASIKLSASGLMGSKTTPEMVFGLMLLCQCEGLNPVAAMKRYHIVEGRPSMRADAMQAEFLAHGGGLLFHVRTDEMVAATLFIDKAKMDDAARKRATDRFEILWALDAETDGAKRSKLMVSASKLSMEGEETIIRTFADCQQKGITEGRDGTKANWKTSPRQMLTARVITEGVRLVNPGLIAGIYNEDETADIVRQEKEALAKILAAPTDKDVDAIMEIIAGYDTELKTDVPDSRRKTLLGLRSDLVCKLGDLGLKMTTPPEGPSPTVGGQPATAVETVVLPPETPAQTKPTRTRRSTTPAVTTPPAETPATDATSTDQTMETPWRDFICKRGNLPGSFNGKTLGHIFLESERLAPKDATQLGKLMDWFITQKIPTSSDAHDVILWAKAQEANAELSAKFAQGAPTTPEITNTAPKATEALQATVGASDWRDYVVKGKAPFAGQKLGDLRLENLQYLKTDYLDKLPDPTRMTLDQKGLAANLALALHGSLPQTAISENADPEHTKALKAAIIAASINRNDCINEWNKAGWIDSKTIEGIKREDAEALLEDWKTASEQVLRISP